MNTRYASPPGTFSFARFAQSKPPFACSQSIYTEKLPSCVYRESTSTSPRAHSGISGLQQVPLRLPGLSHLGSQTPLGLGTGGAQSFQPTRCPWDGRAPSLKAPRYHGGWRDSVLLGTGETQSFQAPRYPEDWRDSVLSGPQPCILGTRGTQAFQGSRYPGDWRDSVLSAPQVPLGLAGLSPFSPSGP